MDLPSARADLVGEIRIAQVLDCLADPEKIRVVAEIPCDVTEALPYLAALLPRAGYNHEAGLLTLVLEGRLLTVYARLVTLAKARDVEDARAVLGWLAERMNEAWGRRGELTPVLVRRRAPRILDVYRLLPGGNCRRCGEATCMALAGRLAFGEASPADCPRLGETEFLRNRALLAEWLGVVVKQ